jgi:hypothetical protein
VLFIAILSLLWGCTKIGFKLVLLQNKTYNTGNVSFLMTLLVSIYIITGREIVGDDHTSIGVEGTAPCVEEVIT